MMRPYLQRLLRNDTLTFWSAIGIGALVIIISSTCVLMSLGTSDARISLFLLLNAIWLTLAGQFGLSLHNYLFQISMKLPSEETTLSEPHPSESRPFR